MLQPVAVSGHVNNLAAVNQAFEDSGGNSSIAEKVGPLVKALVGGKNEGGALAHGGDKTKEQIGLREREGHKAHLVHHYEGSFVEVLEAALAGAGDLSSLEDGHECVQSPKSHGVAQVKALDGQRECEMGLAHTRRPEETDVKSLLQPDHIGQAEHLLLGNATLEAEIKGIQRFLGGKIGPFPAQKILLEDTQSLLFGEEQLHGFQRDKAVPAGKQGVKIHLGIEQVGQQVVHPFQRCQHPESPTFA